MKKILFSLSLLTLTTFVWAQDARSEYEVIKEVFKFEKKAVVADFLHLSDADGAKFWPIYDAYEAERTKIGTERFTNVNNYVNQYNSLTDTQADALVTKSLEIQKNEIALRKKYYEKVKKALGPTRAATFIQIEDCISVGVRYELYDNLPLIGEK